MKNVILTLILLGSVAATSTSVLASEFHDCAIAAVRSCSESHPFLQQILDRDPSLQETTDLEIDRTNIKETGVMIFNIIYLGQTLCQHVVTTFEDASACHPGFPGGNGTGSGG
jgi:hypothetical protein